MKHLETYITGLGSRYTSELLACAISAVEAGSRISARDLSDELLRKDDRFVGHHSIVTEADLLAQRIVFETAERYTTDLFFIGEESEFENEAMQRFRPRTITELDSRLGSVKLMIADPLDGTAQYALRTGAWSVSIGIVDRLSHVAAATFAPLCNFREQGHGVLMIAAADMPTLVISSASLSKPIHDARPAQVSAPTPANKRFVYYGVNAPFLSPPGFLRSFVSKSWTGNTHGSCALGLALVASGDAHAIYQPEQRVWDWVAGKLLVEQAGGVFLPFHVDEKLRASRVSALQGADYNPAEQAISFIAAGDTATAEEIASLLEYSSAEIA